MKFVAILFFLLLAGCATPNFRIGQDEVRQPVRPLITEDIRQASDFLAREINETPQKEVAISLSQRVGPPEKPIDNPETVQRNLNRGHSQYAAQLEILNRWLERRAGTKLEGTGINLLGIGGLLIFVGVIVALILIPALIPIFISLIRNLMGVGYNTVKHTSKGIVKAIEDYKKVKPDEAKELLDRIRGNLDEKDKILVERLRKE